MPRWVRKGGRLAAAVLLCAALCGGCATVEKAAVGGSAAPVATVNGAAITAGEVAKVMEDARRTTLLGLKPLAEDPAASLDLIIRDRLLFDEGIRRGYDGDPAVSRRVEAARERILLEQYVLKHYGNEVAVGEEEAIARKQAGFHKGSSLDGRQWAGAMSSARLKSKVEELIAEAAERAEVEFFPGVYQGVNETGRPTEELVVARAAGEDIVWGMAAAGMPRRYHGAKPPLQGLEAVAFVRAIRKQAGRKLFLKEASSDLDTLGSEVGRLEGAYEQALVIRKLLDEEVEGSLDVSEEEAEAFYRENLDRYREASGEPLAYESVRAAVLKEARDLKRERAIDSLVAELRQKAVVEIDCVALENIKP